MRRKPKRCSHVNANASIIRQASALEVIFQNGNEILAMGAWHKYVLAFACIFLVRRCKRKCKGIKTFPLLCACVFIA